MEYPMLKTKVALLEKLTKFGDRKDFLDSLAQGFSSEEVKQYDNLDEFGNPKQTGIPPVPPAPTTTPLNQGTFNRFNKGDVPQFPYSSNHDETPQQYTENTFPKRSPQDLPKPAVKPAPKAPALDLRNDPSFKTLTQDVSGRPGPATTSPLDASHVAPARASLDDKINGLQNLAQFQPFTSPTSMPVASPAPQPRKPRTPLQTTEGPNEVIGYPSDASTGAPARKPRSLNVRNPHGHGDLASPDELAERAERAQPATPAAPAAKPAARRYPPIDKTFQTMLGVQPDGAFGPLTHAALEAYKKKTSPNNTVSDQLAFEWLKYNPAYKTKQRMTDAPTNQVATNTPGFINGYAVVPNKAPAAPVANTPSSINGYAVVPNKPNNQVAQQPRQPTNQVAVQHGQPAGVQYNPNTGVPIGVDNTVQQMRLNPKNPAGSEISTSQNSKWNVNLGPLNFGGHSSSSLTDKIDLLTKEAQKDLFNNPRGLTVALERAWQTIEVLAHRGMGSVSVPSYNAAKIVAEIKNVLKTIEEIEGVMNPMFAGGLNEKIDALHKIAMEPRSLHKAQEWWVQWWSPTRDAAFDETTIFHMQTSGLHGYVAGYQEGKRECERVHGAPAILPSLKVYDPSLTAPDTEREPATPEPYDTANEEPRD
jgi:hypothetical protein